VTRVTIVGAGGRMGQELLRAVLETGGFELAGGVENRGSSLLGADPGELCGWGKTGLSIEEEPPEDPGVLIEFTAPEATVDHLKYGLPHVIGTTGLSDEQLEAVRDAAASAAIVVAPNMSVGVNLLRGVVGDLSRKLGSGYDVELVETHHRHKRDAPSGTALLLARAAAKGRGQNLADAAVYGREGQIGVHALRGGAVVGEHRLIFYSEGEEIEVVHRALSRRTFADGALRAAQFAARAEPGLYSMDDVLANA
jgi:4-hydroxy-tetrahydrodipicolinate reductase